jgi:hydroxymethylbilane synthase
VAPLKLGTRGSELALFQARAVAGLLAVRAGCQCEIVVIKTSGDRLADAPLAHIGGKRLFVKEIEEALLSGAIDLAVHSSKDMPVALPDGLEIAAVLPREDPRDAVVLPAEAAEADRATRTDTARTLEELVARLGQTPRIGTSSVRRSAQLARLVPGARFLPIRGNLDTRLRKLDAGDYDALVLASAGLRRLGRADRIFATLPIEACVPAPGQGIIAVEIRRSDAAARDIVACIDDEAASAALRAERAVVTALGGGCQMPIGAYAAIDGGTLGLTGIVVSLDGTRIARAEVRGHAGDPESAGAEVAARLRSRGADAILAEVARAQAPVEGRQP